MTQLSRIVTEAGVRAAPPTPLVDRYILDPMRVPPGFLEWARSVESRCQVALDDIEHGEQKVFGEELPAATESRTDLQAIIDDSPRGLLRRTLNRPPWQLSVDSPARASLERHVQEVVTAAATACEVRADLLQLAMKHGDLQASYGSSYPALLRQSFEKARLRPKDLVMTRRAVDVADAERRLERIARELAARLSALAHARIMIQGWTLVPDEASTAPELATCCALALVERSRQARRRSRTAVTYRELLSHLESISVPKEPGTRSAPNHGLVLEELLVRAVRTEQHVRFRGADAPLWCAALSSAADQHAAYRVLTSVLRGATRGREPNIAPQAARSLYIVPLETDLVLISTGCQSAIRVWNATVKLGKTVDGQIIDNLVSTMGEDATRDIQRLYEGFGDDSGWYEHKTRVRVRVVAQFEQGWIGRVQRIGKVRRTPTAAWLGNASDAGEFRVLIPSKGIGLPRSDRTEQLAAPMGQAVGHPFAGFSTDEVSTSIEGDTIAWRRNPGDRGPAAVRALEAERTLFDTLGLRSRSQVRVLRPLGWTSVATGRGKFPLYRMPLAILPTGGAVFESLVGLSLQWRLHTIRSITRCMRQVHETGAVLGTVSHRQFVYAVELAGASLLAVPRPVLAYAPATCRIGDTHVAHTRLDHEAVLYDRLRVPLLNPYVAAGRCAETTHDTYSLGVCALELLALRELSRGPVFYPDLLDAVRQEAAAFAHPDLALQIATALTEGDVLRLSRLVDALCAGLELTAEKWLAVI
jgi:hypothetical protein